MKKLLLATACVFIPAISSAAGPNDAGFNEAVYEALRANPQIVNELQQLAAEAAVAERKAKRAEMLPRILPLLTSEGMVPTGGNPDGTITLIEFYDYNCGYCRKAGPVVEQLVAENPEIKVVYREYPILSDTSELAARASLAAYDQGKFGEFHKTMMALDSPVTQDIIDSVAADLGLDMARMMQVMTSDDANAHIEITKAAAKSIEISGTPTFILGDQVLPGLYPIEHMQGIIDDLKAAE